MTRGRETNEVFVATRGEETPVDVVSEALARTWIDRPAIAVRDELAPPVAIDDDGRDAITRAMPGHELERVVQRAAEVQTALQKIEFDREQKQRRHQQAVSQLDAAQKQLQGTEHRLAAVRSESEQFDRPLVRHLHRSEVESARTQLRWLPAAVEDERAEVADLKREIESLERRSLADRLDEGREGKLKAELVELRSQLTDDARARGYDLADDVSDVVRNRLGPVPSGKATREAWIEAAGRMAQHQAVWDVPEKHILGRKPQMFRDNAYEFTWHAAAKSMSALDRSVGRPLRIEPPSRGLSR